ncbi:MAG: thioredoxin fold domain-containing protein [Acidobacteriota bacterium]
MQFWKTAVVVAGVAALMSGLFGCGDHPEPWVEMDLEAALEEAGERGTLVMVDFKTDWCTWCKRLDRDTFSDPEVITELEELVALQLDAEKEGADAAEKYGIRSFPTIVFLDAAGHEIDRILGYMPPDAFLAEARRIRAGDTFNACLARLNDDPSNIEALERAVEGLLERSDAVGAMARVEAFHSTHGGDESPHRQCRRLMFTARSSMNESLYRSTARLYRRDWPELPEVPDSLGVANLYAVISNIEATEDDRQALRSARFDDAQALLETVDADALDTPQLFEVAGFAFRAGHFDQATDLYRRWFDQRQFGEALENLNQVAWNLYLIGRENQVAIAMAQEAYDVDREPGVGDTLARLLYVDGKVDEAIEIESRAAEGSEGRSAEEFAAVVETMRSGEDLGDRPSFEDFPGEKRR